MQNPRKDQARLVKLYGAARYSAVAGEELALNRRAVMEVTVKFIYMNCSEIKGDAL